MPRIPTHVLIGAAAALFVFLSLATVADLMSQRPTARARPAASTADEGPPPGVIQHVDGRGRVIREERYAEPTPKPSPYARLIGLGPNKTATLWVNYGAYLMDERASEEKDGKTASWVWETYEHFEVPGGTNIEILKIDGRALHVEVRGGGRHDGRRGWVKDIYVDR